MKTWSRLTFVLSAMLAFAGCEGGCTPADPDAGTLDSVGTISLAAGEGGFDIVLAGLEDPLFAIQVDVVVSGTRATGVSSIATIPHDVVEAGLDAPKDRFTVVVSDTRRIQIQNGPLVRVLTESGGSAELSNALAIDIEGARRSLAIGGAQ